MALDQLKQAVERMGAGPLDLFPPEQLAHALAISENPLIPPEYGFGHDVPKDADPKHNPLISGYPFENEPENPLIPNEDGEAELVGALLKYPHADVGTG